MKVVILAGGFGTRLSEETSVKPKPMVEIDEKPILLHIMERYAAYGFTEFLVLTGYKGIEINKYFRDLISCSGSVRFDFRNSRVVTLDNKYSSWDVTCLNTGVGTLTSSRVKMIRPYIAEGEAFFLTYGDGLCDIDFKEQLQHHNSNQCLATVTAVRPAGRFGMLEIQGEQVHGFQEKNESEKGWINGGFFVCDYEFLDCLTDSTMLEDQDLPNLAQSGQLSAYYHTGFWHCMDTLSDKNKLEELSQRGKAPWTKI